VAAGQAVLPPPVSPAEPPLPAIAPQTPPAPTIPTAPQVPLPLPPPGTNRPVKTFDVRPTLGLSEEYSDNFNRVSQHPISNLRSMISPGLAVSLDRGFLTGRATYTLSVFDDSSVNEVGVHHLFAGDFAWQVTPRLKFTLADTLIQSDDPVLA